MMKFGIALSAGCLVAASAFAQDAHEGVGDAAAGESTFRQCQACHVVSDEGGEVLAGRNARTGPNLYNVAGQPAAQDEEFDYSDSLVEAAEAGLEWTPENFIAYVQDPTGFLREFLDDSSARGKMTYRMRSEEDAADVYAFLAQFTAEGGEEAAAAN